MVAADLRRAINSLQRIIEQETAYLRAGDTKSSTKLESEKTEASKFYVAAVLRAQKAQRLMTRLLPDTLTTLQSEHDRLRAALQVNLTVLATAHAVSEAVIRGVNAEVQKRTMPQTYTAYGRQSAPGARHVVPIAVSRNL
jgi:hypothetical protein